MSRLELAQGAIRKQSPTVLELNADVLAGRSLAAGSSCFLKDHLFSENIPALRKTPLCPGSERDQRERRNACEPFKPREERQRRGLEAQPGLRPGGLFFRRGDRRNFYEPFAEREPRSGEGGSATCLFGCVCWCFDCLDGFADFGMSESDLRNQWSRCVSEWRGGKPLSQSWTQAKQGGYLA